MVFAIVIVNCYHGHITIYKSERENYFAGRFKQACLDKGHSTREGVVGKHNFNSLWVFNTILLKELCSTKGLSMKSGERPPVY